jgi:MoxR-like ATPase
MTRSTRYIERAAIRLPEQLGADVELGPWLLRMWRLAVARGLALHLDLAEIGPSAVEAGLRELHRAVTEWGGSVAVRTLAPVALPVPHRAVRRPSWADRVDEWRRRLPDAPALAVERMAGWDLSPELMDAAVTLAAGDLRELERTVARLLAVPVPFGRRMEALRTLDELVVPRSTRATLDRLIWYVDHRNRMAADPAFDRRFRASYGPLVLFAGRSGTGKTLAAEGVAHALGRPLVVVDLAQLVSKYIGETEKNIDGILSAAESSGVVLFFDEADALFASRTEVQSSNDRYANLEVGYLLQRVEQHRGLVILATNLRQSVDEAFLRRLLFRVEFPAPTSFERERIWDQLLPARRAPGIDLAAIAREHRMSGGELRNAALKAMALAQMEGAELDGTHIQRAVEQELLELGRLARREDVEDDPRARLARTILRDVGEHVENRLRERFAKEIHLVYGAPTREALTGKRPAVSLAVFRMTGEPTLRIGAILSAWSQRPDEEPELLVEVHRAVTGLGPGVRLQESFDFDLVHRFWSSHSQPIRASLVVDIDADLADRSLPGR